MELTEYLYEQIPLSKAMGVQVEEASKEKVILYAPIQANINHKKTVFGGSLHAIATLSCWSLLHQHFSDPSYQIVITNSEIDYLVPIDSDFSAECLFPDKIKWERFLQMLHTKGKARILLSSTIFHNGRLAVDFQGVFAVLKL